MVDPFHVLSDLGKIPRKIESKFSSLTADQLKNWILYFSIVALHSVLPREHLECWRLFVLDAMSYATRSIIIPEIRRADELLLHFCRKYEELYGSDRVTPNMHLYAHLSECIYAYGPSQSFWLFSFERYNGLLGKTPTNRKCVEKQMFGRFLKHKFTYNITPSSSVATSSHIRFLLEKLNVEADSTGRGSLMSMSQPMDLSANHNFLQMSNYDFDIRADWTANTEVAEMYSAKDYILSDDEYRCLCSIYGLVYTNDLEVPPNGQKI